MSTALMLGSEDYRSAIYKFVTFMRMSGRCMKRDVFRNHLELTPEIELVRPSTVGGSHANDSLIVVRHTFRRKGSENFWLGEQDAKHGLHTCRFERCR